VICNVSDPTTWLGLDLGTQSARALAVSASSDMLAGASRPLTSHRGGARHEQDPGEWWDALARAHVRRLRSRRRRACPREGRMMAASRHRSGNAGPAA
jgi:sugar (pentulose or hexulose) kinase